MNEKVQFVNNVPSLSSAHARTALSDIPFWLENLIVLKKNMTSNFQ